MEACCSGLVARTPTRPWFAVRIEPAGLAIFDAFGGQVKVEKLAPWPARSAAGVDARAAELLEPPPRSTKCMLADGSS